MALRGLRWRRCVGLSPIGIAAAGLQGARWSKSDDQKAGPELTLPSLQNIARMLAAHR